MTSPSLAGVYLFVFLLSMDLLSSSEAEYQNKQSEATQTKNHEHPRLGNSSIRHCAFNQYWDDNEGRCLIVPGGGVAISIDDETRCDVEVLRGYPSRVRYYYVCRKTKTILAECSEDERFENRLKRCAIDTLSSNDSRQQDDELDASSYDHVDLPACDKPGRFPVSQDDCTAFYSCTSNGFRLYRTIYECPSSTGFDPVTEMCTTEHACHENATPTRPPDDGKVVVETTTRSTASTAASMMENSTISATNTNSSVEQTTRPFLATTTARSSGTPEPADSSERPGISDTTVAMTSATPNKNPSVEPTTRPFLATTTARYSVTPEPADSSERPGISDTTVAMTSATPRGLLVPDNETTTSRPSTVTRVHHTTFADDYVTSRNDYTKEAMVTESTIAMTSNTDDVLTTTDESWTNQFAEVTRDTTVAGIELEYSSTTESPIDPTDEPVSEVTVAASPTTIVEDTSQRATTESESDDSTSTGFSSRHTEAQETTTISNTPSIDESSNFNDEPGTTAIPQETTDSYDGATSTTTEEEAWESSSTAGIEGSTSVPTDAFDTTADPPISSAPRDEETTTIVEWPSTDIPGSEESAAITDSPMRTTESEDIENDRSTADSFTYTSIAPLAQVTESPGGGRYDEGPTTASSVSLASQNGETTIPDFDDDLSTAESKSIVSATEATYVTDLTEKPQSQPEDAGKESSANQFTTNAPRLTRTVRNSNAEVTTESQSLIAHILNRIGL